MAAIPTIRNLATFLLAVVCGLAIVSSSFGQNPKEVYQDFRQKRPLLDSLKFSSSDIASEFKSEDEGLRITLTGTRDNYWPADIVPSVVLTGDFELTGTYELMSANKPKTGYGVGVHLAIADTDKREVFAKVCRCFRAAEGSVHLTEHWNRAKPKGDYRLSKKDTTEKSGQLRLAREGTTLYYLVSDGPGLPFREVAIQKDFPEHDIEHIRFGVSDSGAPGNPVDARLIDFRIRPGKAAQGTPFDAAPLAAPVAIVNPPIPDIQPKANADSSSMLLLLILAGVVVLLLGGIAMGVFLFVRRRNATATQDESATAAPTKGSTVAVCPACGAKLRVKQETLGRKFKCPKCGQTVVTERPSSD